MNIPPKDTNLHTFVDNVDSDTADDLIESTRARSMQNVRVRRSGKKGVVTNILGTTLIQNQLPAGNNIGIGWGKNEAKNKLYYFNYNDQGNHGIYAYDSLTRSVSPVLLNKTDSNGVDILKFNKDYLINHVDIINDNLIYWVDGFNKARKFNIAKAIDKTTNGYAGLITEDIITAYKQCGVFAPKVEYFTDLSRNSNYLYGQQYKFCYRYYYDDNEISNWSDWSAVPLPANESYLGVNAISFDNNAIKVTVETGNKIVTKIHIAVKINDLNFVGCITLNKAKLAIDSNSVYTYYFYNDGAYEPLDQAKVLRAYSYLPDRPHAQAFLNKAMAYARFYEGFEYIPVKGSVALTYKPFYLPSGTVSHLNNPLFTATLVGDPTSHGGIFNTWWTVTYHFEVGQDVKRGNDFQIDYTGGNSAYGGGPGNKIADSGDTASTIASYMKQYLRSLDGVGAGTIFNESIDGSGNVTWDFTIEAHEGNPPFRFFTNVQPVNYSTLLDNGLSINCIKQGSIRKYGIVYEDDDGRTSLTYTDDSLVIKTLFETETILGQAAPIGLQQAIHTVSITTQPPVWAKYWRLVRTQDLVGYIQMLIQKVITVKVADQDTYLDLAVGSLFTYQKIHPEAADVIKYEFVKGDRLRLISDENTVPATLYTPYFETEVLGYSIDTEEFKNANIVTDGSAEVTPSDGVHADYVGKSIILNNIERLITGIDGAKYVLDEPVSGDGFAAPTSVTLPNYKLVDRRGLIRIKKPVGYNIVDFSLVEVYHPQKNTNDSDFQNFFDFQMKFNVANWGTPTRAHNGNIQNQDPANLATTPAIIQVTNGDSYVRNRFLPTSNANPNPQGVIDRVSDPNFSDFYQSNLYNLGRVYPQDQAFGKVFFGKRVRFSTDYIQDTQVNGLNDFNNTDREDYDDQYGLITLMRFRGDYLFIFKQLKSTWTPVNKKIIVDNAGAETLATSEKLLNDLQYAVFEAGIGDNGEGWFENGNSQYIPSAIKGVFLRIAQDGSIPISSKYLYDKKAREILGYVNKYNLRIPGGYDIVNDEGLWSIQSFIHLLFNGGFNSSEWQTILNAYPVGTTFTITQQPANSTATVVDGIIQITDTDTLGDDFFLMQGHLPGGGTTPVFKMCFSVIEQPNRVESFRARANTNYCLLRAYSFRGRASSKYCLLREYSFRARVSSEYCLQEDLVGNEVQHQVFTKDCSGSPGTTGTPYDYVVPADTFFAATLTDANNLALADIAANGQAAANTHGTCVIDTQYATIFVDYFSDSDADLCFYCDTVGVAESGQIVSALTNLLYPDDGSDPAICYLAASSKLTQSSPKRRFGVNLNRFIVQYPAITSFTFRMRGRSNSGMAVTGQYVLKQADQGNLTLVPAVNPPELIPSATNTSNIGITAYSSNIIGGTDGSVGTTVGAVVLDLVYDRVLNTLTVTTH